MKLNFFEGLSRRGFVRICSFLLAAVIVLGGFTISGYAMAFNYRNRLEMTYQQNLTELSDHLNNIQTTLSKGIYASTLSGATNLAMQLWNEAGAAQVCLSNLPVSNQPLTNTNKFLSQVGDYSISLAKKMGNGQGVTPDDRQNLKTLSKYAKQLNSAVDEMATVLNNNGEWTKQVKSVIENNNKQTTNLSDGFKNLEDSFSDFPTLLYDGPFSDHILQAQAQFLLDKNEVDQKSAFTTACRISKQTTLTYNGETKGQIPCYSYSRDGMTIDITKMGGYCSYFLNPREIRDATIDKNRCIEIALDYVRSMGLGNFKQSYYAMNEGVCVVNLAYTENDVIYYTDLIKVGVATDNGEVVSYNAQGYIMNHREREYEPPKHTQEQAQKSVSDMLTVISSELAVIPLDTLNEKLCYEFVCKSSDGEDILVYINAETLQEEKILILLKSDGGTLTL